MASSAETGPGRPPPGCVPADTGLLSRVRSVPLAPSDPGVPVSFDVLDVPGKIAPERRGRGALGLCGKAHFTLSLRKRSFNPLDQKIKGLITTQ